MEEKADDSWWLVIVTNKKQRAKNLLENGRMLQEQMIGLSNGKSNRIRSFTSQELQEATNGYKFRIAEYTEIFIFKGYLLDIPICVHKRWSSRSNEWYSPNMNLNKKPINNVVFASQMSVHKNVLKLLGVCLEEENAIAVYEWAEHRSLLDCLLMHRTTPSGTNMHQQPPLPLPWKLRLKITAEVANVVVYLHTAFSRPIVHRDINPSHVLLDQQNVAKLCDFSLCIPIPEGKVRVTSDSETGFIGSSGYIPPEYYSTDSCSEKADVFNFGILLLVLLTARRASEWDRCHNEIKLLDRVRRSVKDNGVADIVDPRILAEPFAGCPGMHQQLERFAELALSCAADREEDRPEMIDVEKQLWQMEQSTPNTAIMSSSMKQLVKT